MRKANPKASLLRLRVLVSFLGEKKQSQWWQSDFWSSSAPVFLAPVFPRTLFLSQCEGSSLAARLVHDERIGVGHVFHLFRLPENLEQQIHQDLKNREITDGLLPLVTSKEAAWASLVEEFGSPKPSDVVGPVLCGDASQIMKTGTIGAMAKAYMSGFDRSVPVFPYLKEVE